VCPASPLAEPSSPAGNGATIRITVNGEPQQLATPLSVGSLVEGRGLAGKRIAVELNGAIVPRSKHAMTPLVDADRVEIVVAVGGG
jgi:sulfur carrier protein